MQLSIARRIRADHGELAALVRAALATVDHAGVMVKLKGRNPTVTWLVRCGVPARCRVPVNLRDDDGYGHVMATRSLAQRLTGGAHGPVERRVQPSSGVRGRTYGGVPRLASVPAQTRYLVTLGMPIRPESIQGRYPLETVYAQGRPNERRRSPRLTLRCWHEELFAVAAHEAKHVEQFRQEMSRSENRAEEHAAAALAVWRQRHRCTGTDGAHRATLPAIRRP